MKNQRKTRTAAELKQFRFRKLANRHQGEKTGIHPRSLARSVAKAQMQRAKWTHINRHFAYNWQNVIRQTVKQERKA